MNNSQSTSPGTVSKILWHFTGGPKWNKRKKRQNITRKSTAEAYKNLVSILKIKELRLGSYKEIVKVIIPEYRYYNTKKGKIEIKKNVPEEIISSSVCCLADIPAPHLRYHSYRYGKFAIGFHRSAIINYGFNPVFYTLVDTPVIRSIYESFSATELIDTFFLGMYLDDMEGSLDNIDIEVEDISDVNDHILDIRTEIEAVEDGITDMKDSLKDFVAFIKTFEKNEFNTIYCEREWRSTKEYKFDINDVAMIVIPKQISPKNYYRDFVDNISSQLKLPKHIPIVPWEDLVEH